MVLIIRDRSDLAHQIVTLHAEGWSLRALGRRFHISRNTVRRIVRTNRSERDKGHDAVVQKALRKSKLDAWLPRMGELLEKYPDITGVRMFEKLTAAGFDGKKTIVMDRLRQLRPAAKRQPVVRFETDPGQQGQMDWSPYTIDFARSGRQKLLCFSYILGFSRRHYIDFTVDRKFFTLIRRHQDAFGHFQGVPHTCLYDGEKTVVLRWEAGQPVFNPSFVAFITHYHCRPIACAPGRAQTKGKVEQPFLYIEKNLLNARKFHDMDDLRQTARWWLANRSDVHIHDTTGRPPLELFESREKAALRPLPLHPYDSAEVALRVCRVDGFLEHDTNLYSVPYAYVADILTLKATENEVFIYSPHLELIGRHPRHPFGAGIEQKNPDHHRSQKARWGLEPVRQAFLALGDAAEDFLTGLKQRHPHHCGQQARAVLRLKAHYLADDIHAAMVHALKYHAFEARAVQRILKARFSKRPLESHDTLRARKALRALPSIRQRPLNEYGPLLQETDP